MSPVFNSAATLTIVLYKSFSRVHNSGKIYLEFFVAAAISLVNLAACSLRGPRDDFYTTIVA